MKRKTILSVFLLIMMLILPNISVFAAESYYYDGKWNLYTAKDVTVILDDKKVNFDVPPLLIEDRTMVPARAVFEKAGADVFWNEKKRQVIVENDTYSVILTIDSNVGKVNGKSYTMDVPAKIVTDEAGVARTLIPLRFISERMGYTVLWDSAEYTAFVYTDKYEGEIPQEKTYSITKIKNYISNDDDIVEIYAESTEFEPKIFVLTSPTRLVLDFSDLKLGIPDGATAKSGRTLKNVRYAYQPDGYSRVVIDLDILPEYRITKDDNVYKLILSGSTYKNINYYNTGGYKIEFKEGTLTKKSFDDKKFVYIFTSTSNNLGEGVINSNDTYIKNVEITPQSAGTKITINAKTALEFTINNSRNSSVLTYKRIEIDKTSDEKLTTAAKDYLVVVDAGHGGSDPGAVGKDGDEIDLEEKEVTLDVSLMLRDILENSGVKVLMTREIDEYVELDTRAEIANENDATLFVSVHINSFTSPDPTGSMVYYYAKADTPPEDEDLTEEEKREEEEYINNGKVLAQNILDEIVTELDTVDRGLGDGSRFLVIRKTTMPAVIIEPFFISNPSDKALMKKAEVREKLAHAIADGVIETLNYLSKQ